MVEYNQCRYARIPLKNLSVSYIIAFPINDKTQKHCICLTCHLFSYFVQMNIYWLISILWSAVRAIFSCQFHVCELLAAFETIFWKVYLIIIIIIIIIIINTSEIYRNKLTVRRSRWREHAETIRMSSAWHQTVATIWTHELHGRKFT